MSSIDQQFIEYIVKSLVGNPDAVKVERRIDEKGVLAREWRGVKVPGHIQEVLNFVKAL